MQGEFRLPLYKRIMAISKKTSNKVGKPYQSGVKPNNRRPKPKKGKK